MEAWEKAYPHLAEWGLASTMGNRQQAAVQIPKAEEQRAIAASKLGEEKLSYVQDQIYICELMQSYHFSNLEAFYHRVRAYPAMELAEGPAADEFRGSLGEVLCRAFRPNGYDAFASDDEALAYLEGRAMDPSLSKVVRSPVPFPAGTLCLHLGEVGRARAQAEILRGLEPLRVPPERIADLRDSLDPAMITLDAEESSEEAMLAGALYRPDPAGAPGRSSQPWGRTLGLILLGAGALGLVCRRAMGKPA